LRHFESQLRRFWMLRTMSATRIIREMIPTTKYLIRGRMSTASMRQSVADAGFCVRKSAREKEIAQTAKIETEGQVTLVAKLTRTHR
jgi:hypothetical protein